MSNSKVYIIEDSQKVGLLAFHRFTITATSTTRISRFGLVASQWRDIFVISMMEGDRKVLPGEVPAFGLSWEDSTPLPFENHAFLPEMMTLVIHNRSEKIWTGKFRGALVSLSHTGEI